jgi:hypothetical protein
MKKLLLATGLFCLLITNISIGQERTIEKRVTIDSKGNKDSTEAVIVSKTEDITPRNNIITINPLKFILFYNLNYYHKIDNNTVIGGGIQTPTLKDIDGFGINAEIRIHPSSKAPKGFYFAPNFSFNSLTTTGSKSNAKVFSMGILVGWQWFPGTDFAMGLGIGIDRYFISNSKSAFSSYDGNAPALRFDIGYGW